MTTFNILEGFRELEAMLDATVEISEGEEIQAFKDEDIKEYLDLLNEEKETKLDNIEYLKREYKSSMESLREEVKRLQNRIKSNQRNIDKLSSLQLDLLRGNKLKTNKFTYILRNTKSVEVANYFDTDANIELCRTKVEPDKKKIKEALESGSDIFGAKIVTKQSMSVR